MTRPSSRSPLRRRRLWLIAAALLAAGLLVATTVSAPLLHAQNAPAAEPLPAAEQRPARSDAAPSVLINEILSHTDAPLVDSIELYNRTAQPVAIGGWCLSDKPEEPCLACLPAGLQVPANGFLVLEQPLFGFGLAEEGEDLLLTEGAPACTPSGAQHRVRFDASPNGVSLGRLLNANGHEFFPLQRSRTLGAPNSGPILPPRLAIVEVAAQPPAGEPQYIELFNPGVTGVPLFDPAHPENRWRVAGVGTVSLPATTLPPGASIFLSSEPAAQFRSRYALPAALAVLRFSGSLRADGERITLESPEPPNAEDGFVPYVVVDEVGAEDVWPWQGAAVAARSSLTTFAQEPAAWGAPRVPLESGPVVQGLRMEVAPAGGGRGRVVRWQTSLEWRAERFSVTIEALDSTGATLPGESLLLELPAQGSRHIPATYEAAHLQADPAAAYRYSLRVRWWDGSEQLLATVESGPEVRLWVPLVRTPAP